MSYNYSIQDDRKWTVRRSTTVFFSQSYFSWTRWMLGFQRKIKDHWLIHLATTLRMNNLSRLFFQLSLLTSVIYFLGILYTMLTLRWAWISWKAAACLQKPDPTHYRVPENLRDESKRSNPVLQEQERRLYNRKVESPCQSDFLNILIIGILESSVFSLPICSGLGLCL